MPDRLAALPFLWGAATSAHQVEGHDEASDWHAWENAPGTPCAEHRLRSPEAEKEPAARLLDPQPPAKFADVRGPAKWRTTPHRAGRHRRRWHQRFASASGDDADCQSCGCVAAPRVSGLSPVRGEHDDGGVVAQGLLGQSRIVDACPVCSTSLDGATRKFPSAVGVANAAEIATGILDAVGRSGSEVTVDLRGVTLMHWRVVRTFILALREAEERKHAVS